MNTRKVRWLEKFLLIGVESLEDLQFVTRQDLRDMGMAIIHQRKFFNAYAALNLPQIEQLQ